MIELKGVEQVDYISYFMKSETLDAFSGEHSGVDVVYWRSTTDDLTQNVYLAGIDSLDECHMACLLSTAGDCWVFRFVFYSTVNSAVAFLANCSSYFSLCRYLDSPWFNIMSSCLLILI